jgi:hypothetical protein
MPLMTYALVSAATFLHAWASSRRDSPERSRQYLTSMNAFPLSPNAHPGLRRLFSLAGRMVFVLAAATFLSVDAQAQPAGTVIGWGNNSSLQLQIPPALNSVIGVAAGSAHSLALKNDGTVVGWGLDVSGQADPPLDLTSATAIQAGLAYSLALKNDHTVVSWGDLSSPSDPITNALAIAAGATHALALLADGTVISWGSQTDVPVNVTNVTAIAAGNGQSLALRADGSVIAWGDTNFGKATVPANLTNAVMIAAGADHSLALKRDGTVVAWGSNAAGQTNVPAGLGGVIAIAAGASHCLALKTNGTIVAWGDNTFGQSTPAASSNFVAIAGGGSHSLGIRGNGAPVIFVQPVSVNGAITKTASFQVMAAGSSPLGYYWRKNGSNIAGATNSSLSFNNIQFSDAAAYSVLVSNSVGTVLSSNAILTPFGLVPFVTVSPQNLTAICGENTTLRGAGDGSTPLLYQWQFEGAAIGGATKTSLQLTNLSGASAGNYTLVITNAFGSITSAPALLTIQVVPPAITSPLTVPAKQGQLFTYTIRGQHTPIAYAASGLPPGLSVNTTNGVISGLPLVSGTFGPLIYTFNNCTSAVATLVINFESSIPIITSPLTASGGDGVAFNYQITATNSPTSFGAYSLPLGLQVDTNGLISGKPIYAGNYSSTIWASNVWGVGSATLQLAITNGPITGLSIVDVETNYSSPYLLDFQFSLKDSDDPTVARGVVANPHLFSMVCQEDGQTISSNETAVIIDRATVKQFKTVLALDFTESIASLSNGDSNGDGISDAVDDIVAGAIDFVDQQRPGAQVGVYEFHREDFAPQRVAALTTDHALLDSSIAGIWTNYVQWFPAASRAWDALIAAIGDLGPTNSDEQHYAVLVSDGKDESSFATVKDVIKAATNNNVKVFCIGFGAELDPAPLQSITAATQGKYYDAAAIGGITPAFDQIGKDLNGRYLLRWATLKRSTNSFMPSFQLSYQGFTANSPTNPVYMDTNNPIIDTNSMPPTTNYPLLTNFVISPYTPSQHTGSVTVGALRLVPNAAVLPSSVTLRASYVPRYIRQLRIHYRANWPCTPVLQSTNVGEILYGWGLTETNDGAGGKWLLASSPNPQSLSNSIPFGALGDLIQFQLRDALTPTNAFSLFTIDNTIYTNTGNQSFTLNSTNEITVYAALPFGTPVPWLIAHGFTNNFAAAELSDPDNDGVLTWQEYVANTDPRDPNSVFRVKSALPGFDGRYLITFTTSLNRAYRVQASADLTNWQLVEDSILGTGGDVTITDPRYIPGVIGMFYRVQVY